MTALNEWGYTPEQWANLTPQKRWKIKNRDKTQLQQKRRRERWKESPELYREAIAADRAYKDGWKERNKRLTDKYRQTYRERKKAEREAIKAAQEAARKALIPVRRKENRAAFDKDPAGLYASIRRAIPRSFPADVRDDIATDISIALLDGEIALDEIETSVSQFLSKHYQGRDWHQNISFDQPIAGTNDLRLGDRIAADAFHF